MKPSDLRPKGIFEAYDTIEFIVVAFVAGLILWVGPVLLAFHYAQSGRPVAATIAAVLWVGTVATCLRDLRRRSWSWVSTIVCVTWFLLMLIVGSFT